MNNVNAKIIKGNSKKGNAYKAIQFEIMTSQGVYKSPLIFPTNLEINLVEQAISPVKDFYTNDVSNNEL